MIDGDSILSVSHYKETLFYDECGNLDIRIERWEPPRRFRRVWIHAHYRKHPTMVGLNGKPVKRWIKGYWKKIIIGKTK